MQKITTHLWFDKEAKKAADFYVATFKDAAIKDSSVLHNTPSGDVDMVNLDILGHGFSFISAGPLFTFNPSVSFLVASSDASEVEGLWGTLSEGGTVMMELGEYPFSQKYGWLQDKYGVSWQIMLVNETEIQQRITPTIMFAGDVCGKAEEAINYYVSVFDNSAVGDILRYEKDEGPDKEGTVKHAGFTLEGQEFAAMDNARTHDFSFSEAISFIVTCENQEEIDYYWDKLSAVPESEQCGWLKDKYGLSWQIVPAVMDEMLRNNDEKKMAQVTEAFLKMKKFDIAELQAAYDRE